MLNLDETLTTISSYNKTTRYLFRFFLFTVITFVEYLRGQVAEVNLLQLIPGFYLFYYLLRLFSIWSDFFQIFILLLMIKNHLGTKTKNKLELTLLLKFSYFLFFIVY